MRLKRQLKRRGIRRSPHGQRSGYDRPGAAGAGGDPCAASCGDHATPDDDAYTPSWRRELYEIFPFVSLVYLPALRCARQQGAPEGREIKQQLMKIDEVKSPDEEKTERDTERTWKALRRALKSF